MTVLIFTIIATYLLAWVAGYCTAFLIHSKPEKVVARTKVTDLYPK